MNPRCYGTLYRQNVHDMFRLRNLSRERSFKVEIDRLHVHNCPLPSPHDFVGFVFVRLLPSSNYNNAPQGEGMGWGWGWGWFGGILTHTEGRGNQDSRPL